MRRRKMTRKQSNKNFRKGTKVKSTNAMGRPMRGGIRL